MSKEIKLKSDVDFPKRASNISSQMTVATYVSDLVKQSNINLDEIAEKPSTTPIPTWEMLKATFDIDYTDAKKSESVNISICRAREHVDEKYSTHLHIFTVGSVLENKCAGAAFYVPKYKIIKSFFIGANISIFTAELVAILQALHYLVNLTHVFFKVVLFVDSKFVLYALQSFKFMKLVF